MSTRNIVLVTGALIALLLYVFMVRRMPEEPALRLVVASWGGSFQDAQRQALFEPFEGATGIEIIEVTGPSMARIKAMVDSGRADWDVALMTPADVLSLGAAGYLIALDYDDPVLKEALEQIDSRAVLAHGIGDFFSSKVISFNTNYFPKGNHPRNWAEFWDVKRFPGPRVIDAGDWSVPPVEYALLADGVAPEDLYPLDFDRAYRSIAKIAPHVLKFSTSPVMPAQALVDGEAALAAATVGRIAQLKQQGAPVDFEWNQGLMEVNYWVIVRNTKSYDSAMEFLRFTIRPDIQAAMARLQPLGPSNAKAFEFLSPERARQLPTYPENLDKQIYVDATFWAATNEAGKSNTDRNAELWSRFALTQ
jgi:putative spermidine/putrescine transport system substrate-binding protein